ncbi:MAG: DUF4974 domain-containing protein, partial [Bacteroidia bacterium]|nr:DUF4974 domain-containing protein [Bacteroidia bacterium]
MGNKTERFILILIVCFACQTQLVAQDDTNTQPLAEVLETLEDRYQVQFNYAQDSIENVVTRVPSEDLTLAEVLAFLEQETDLNFKLSNNFVLVSKRNDIILCGYLLDKDNLSPLENATIQG